MTEIFSTSKPAHAVIYPRGGVLTRLVKTELKEGHNRLIVRELSDAIDRDSLRVQMRGKAKIQLEDIQLRNQREKHSFSEEKIRPLREKLEVLAEEEAALHMNIESLEEEKQHLNAFGSLNTQKQHLEVLKSEPKLDSWKETLDFLRERGLSLKTEIHGLSKQREEKRKEQQRISKEIQQIIAPKLSNYLELVLDLQAGEDCEPELEISYFINSCSWRPIYEARTDSYEKEVNLSYSAQVLQSTGENWDDISLELSTATPHVSATPPELSPWAVREFVPMPAKPQADRSMMKRKVGKSMSAAAAPNTTGAAVPREVVRPESQVKTPSFGATVSFLPPGLKNISGDGSANKVLIMQKVFPSKFSYFTVPKKSKFIFLKAEVENDTDYPLIQGEIRIFLDGTFIGNSKLKKLIPAGEQFELSLGKDEAVSAERIKLKEDKDEKGLLFGKEYKVTFEYLIRIKNSKTIGIRVKVWDQLPVSENSKIRIENVSISPKEHEAKKSERLPNGTLEWIEDLDAGEEKEFRIGFELVYPKDMNVVY